MIKEKGGGREGSGWGGGGGEGGFIVLTEAPTRYVSSVVLLSLFASLACDILFPMPRDMWTWLKCSRHSRVVRTLLTILVRECQAEGGTRVFSSLPSHFLCQHESCARSISSGHKRSGSFARSSPSVPLPLILLCGLIFRCQQARPAVNTRLWGVHKPYACQHSTFRCQTAVRLLRLPVRIILILLLTFEPLSAKPDGLSSAYVMCQRLPGQGRR